MHSLFKLWAKFKQADGEAISFTFTPVIAWERKGDGEYVAIVLRQPSMYDSATAYAVDNQTIIKDYGYVVSFILDENIKQEIASTQTWIDKDNENRSIYVYPNIS